MLGSLRVRMLLALVAVLAVGVLPAAAQETPRESKEMTRVGSGDYTTPLTEREKIYHLLSRLTFGATPKLVDEVAAKGINNWLDEQLAGGLKESRFLQRELGKFDSLELSAGELMRKYQPADPTLSQPERNRLRNVPRRELRDAVLLRAIYGRNQVKEVLSDFFRNHFNIDAEKNQCKMFATAYDREVIRKHALGRFGDMLIAQAKSPAMLVYLDNYLSRRPLTKAELKAVERRALQRKRKRNRTDEDVARALEKKEIASQRGLNENYGREILELHTLGVDNYYTQQDVIEVSKALTGWTVRMRPGRFYFNRGLHIQGSKRFLGRVIKARRTENGIQEGEEILQILIRHPGTAKFLSWKLCRWLVADDPPDDMVKRIASVWMRTGGDIPKVVKAIVNDRDFFNPRYYQAKFKRPLEFVAAAIRATGAQVKNTRMVHQVLALMNEPIYHCEDPTGYYDQAEAWRDAGAMATRWQFAMGMTLGRKQMGRSIDIPESYWESLPNNDAQRLKDALAARVCPSGISPRTSDAIDGVIRKYRSRAGSVRALGPAILGMLLGSPEFQKQ